MAEVSRGADAVRKRSGGTTLIGTTDDESCRILAADHGLAELLASTTQTLTGTRLCDHIHPDDRPRALEAFTQMIGDATSEYEGSGRLVAADGAVHRVTLYASVVASDTRLAIVLRIAALPA
ncbi:MAG: PAS domain-containing protein [Solirubrobacteraceae bacterium]